MSSIKSSIVLGTVMTFAGSITKARAVTLSCNYLGTACEREGGIIDGSASDYLALYGEPSLHCKARGKIEGIKRETSNEISMHGLGPGASLSGGVLQISGPGTQQQISLPKKCSARRH